MPIEPTLRFAVGGVIHETNTFATQFAGKTLLQAFERFEGEAIATAFDGANHQVGGFIEGARRAGAEIAWTFLGQATPSGIIAHDAYETMKSTLLASIRTALPVDGVLLALHGAGVAEGVDDIEGDLAAAVRDLVGADVPIAAAFDLHGNVTPLLIDSCDIVLPCRLYPHTDFWDRGIECVELLVRTVRGELHPVTRVRQIPMLQYIVPTTPGFAPNRANSVCAELTMREGVEDCSWFHGFPLSDIAAPCTTAICITNGNAELAEECVTQLASWLWEHRREFEPDMPTPTEGVREAVASAASGRPFVIGDYADNPGGGAPGDGTHLLRALIEAQLPEGYACFAAINDADIVRQAIQEGVGATIEVSLGGKLGAHQGRPINGPAYVKALTDGCFASRPGSMFAGVKIDIGPMCRLLIGGVDVLVSSRAEQIYDAEPFLLHGIDVMRYRIVALKGANHFRAGFMPLASKIITVDGGGLSSARLDQFTRHSLVGRLWPLHEDATWTAQASAFPTLTADARPTDP